MDPIADMLIKIKNAQAVNHLTVDVPYSKMKYAIANILLERGLIDKLERKFKKNKKIVRLTLKYQDHKPVIHGVKRISKPGRRIYLQARSIKSSKSQHSLIIISTSRGVMPGDVAKKRNLGGEIVAEIW